ncbi:hypothetical protein C8J57DRAFT_1075621, partial [Mycena rebaudengoi]
TDLICTPSGECKPCPADALHEPFCQPFGSRRLMHCLKGNDTVSAARSAQATTSKESRDTSPHIHEGEVRAWASCGRSPMQERADFYEFVACNVLFAAVALFGVVVRSRRQRAIQARTLAARIGVARR